MISSPDQHARALLDAQPDALRYDGHTDDPAEVAGLLRSVMPSGVRVLDVGCGTGSVTVIANREKGNDVLCLEPDSLRAERARSRGLNVLERLLDEGFVAEQQPFDVVMFSDVLEHIASPAEMLELAVRALKPGGLVLVSVPNVAHWSVRANLLFGRFEYQEVGIMDSTHLRWFTAKSLTSLMERSGLRVVSLHHTAGTTLPIYGNIIFRAVPGPIRTRAIRLGARLMPRLFGCQHVIVGRKEA